MYVIRIIARADGTSSPEAGRFVRDFDPSYAGGIGFLLTTEDRRGGRRGDRLRLLEDRDPDREAADRLHRLHRAAQSGGRADAMAIERVKLRKLVTSSETRASYEVLVTVTGRTEPVYVGDVHKRGKRRWVWGCNLPDPEAGAPTVGREDTRAEAVTTLMAHVREGNHPHLTEPPQGDRP
jgi:hypothetical protein